MIKGLVYYKGATPGAKRAAPQLSNAQAVECKKEKYKKYEESRPDRKFMDSWKEGRPWLDYDPESKVMTCKTCISYYKITGTPQNTNLPGQNKFLTGCSNRKITAVTDHESSKAHMQAVERTKAKDCTKSETVRQSSAGRALLQLKSAERNRLAFLFRNSDAVAKNNRPLSDYSWLCSLDQAKGLDLGTTYLNPKAALVFLSSISEAERETTKKILKEANYFSFMMDGSTDVAGDEQEVIYVRAVLNGKPVERFLKIGSPSSTCASDLFDFCLQAFEENEIDRDKLIGFGSDGASNMVGKRGGLAALLRDKVSSEIINVHCLSHCLELSFRDVKSNKLYDQLISLLIGLHYFYIKQYKNKSGLQNTIKALNIQAVMPPKMTGTRWLPHLSKGLESFFKTFKAYEAHLATISHHNARAEGMLKTMLNKSLICFALFLKDVLDPLMKLSLKLQKPGTTLSDSLFWVEATADLMSDFKSSNSEQLSEVLVSGTFQGIQLMGRTPSLNYKEDILNGFAEAIRSRFQLQEHEISVLNSTKILNFKLWPKADSPKFGDFGNSEIQKVTSHFQETLLKTNPDFNVDAAQSEWKMLKRVLSKRYDTLDRMSWAEAFVSLEDFPSCMQLVNILLTLPPTSVSCETTFSHMKLIKTSRRTRLKSSTLNDLLMVKLQSPDVDKFDPELSIDMWLGSALKPRKLNYSRNSKQQKETLSLTDDQPEDTLSDLDVDTMYSEEKIEDLDTILGKDSDSEFNCFGDFNSEEAVFEKMLMYSRE